MDEPTVVNVHTEKKIKRKRKERVNVSTVTELEDKIYNYILQEATLR